MLSPNLLTVSLDSVGKCEHCGAIMSIEGFPPEAMSVEWRCPICDGVLTGATFGYEGDTRTGWVGPDGEWASERPKECFELGRLFVNVYGVESL